MKNLMQMNERGGETARRAGNTAFGAMLEFGFAWLDLMSEFQRQMQRASMTSFSTFSPTANTRITGTLPEAHAATQAAAITVIPVGEERLNVATHTVPGETTRIRRRVVSQPVEQEVRLRDETVVIERRPGSGEPRADVLTETVVEMSDTRQVPTVWKSLHVAEEIVLRKHVTERTEKVRETVRRDVVDVEQNPHANLPAVVTPLHGRELTREMTREMTRESGREIKAQAPHRPAHDTPEQELRQAASAEKREDDKKPAGVAGPQPPRKA